MKKNSVKKLLVSCLTVAALLSLPLSSYAEEDADSLREQISSLESENQELQEKIEQLESENADLRAENGTSEETDAGTEARRPGSAEASDTDEEVEILEEYTLPDSIGWYTRHFMVVRNNTDETVSISSQSLAYSPDGSLVSAANGSIDALGAGCTTVFYEAFETDEEIASYDTTMTVSDSRFYESVNQDLSYIETDISGGAIFQVTNEGTEAAEFVEGYTLFFLNGELVDYDDVYFTDDDSELKPGATITNQINAYQDFDAIEFYLDGRRYTY